MNYGRKILAVIFVILVLGTMAVAQTQSLPDFSALPESRELPDPLLMLDGRRVTTGEQWRTQRRPELKTLFQHYMYGYLPPAPKNIQATMRREDKNFFGGKATLKEITIAFGPAIAPKIDLLLIVPNKRQRRAPVIVGLNFCGNHAVVNDPAVALPRGWAPKFCQGVKDNRATDAGRGSNASGWAAEQTIDRGYALATFYHGDIAPDQPDFSQGVFPHYLKAGQSHPGPHDWGAIAAWAWGVHRAIDYLVTDRDIDRNRIAAFGHSRNGKAILLAAAFDERIAVVFPHQSGCGGAAPSRTTVGESVTAINERFPHWFNDTFPQFGGHEAKLPFDQHALIALVAPGPLLLTNAMEDQWANPAGQFDNLRAADKVYRLLNAGGLAAQQMPEPNRLIDSTLGYYIRPGKHSTTPEDWQVFLNFADKHLKGHEGMRNKGK
jgi:hypothetical protein